MGYRDQTDMGGTGDAFLTTHWSMIENIQSQDDRDCALIGVLLDKYWKPVYCFLRRRGHNNEEAKDLTQGFFHEIVLNRKLIQKADISKGRFRSFLLFALKQYLMNETRRETAQIRIPKHKLVSLDVVDLPVLPQTVIASNPEDSYHYAWVSSLLDQVLSEVKATCLEQVMEMHWLLFNDRIVQPMLYSAAIPTLPKLCEKYGIESEKKVSNMIITVKRRFQTTLRRHLRNTVASDQEMDDELQEIMQFLPKRAQHSQ
jgi:RNA polymerase sigma-70 factor (ECF subfamily)